MVPPYSHRIPRALRYSGYSSLTHLLNYMTITFFGMSSQTFQLTRNNAKCCPYPKGISTLGLASFPFARHYSENLGWFLFLALLRCFSSGGSPHIPIWFSIWCMCIHIRIAPFGNLRIKRYLLFPAAYRSLSRPSSAPDAKAFPLRSS